MKAGDRFIDRATGQSGTIEVIFLAGDQRGYKEIDDEDVPDLAVLVVRLDNDGGWITADVSAAELAPLDSVLH